jgi:hypothetical protein
MMATRIMKEMVWAENVHTVHAWTDRPVWPLEFLGLLKNRRSKRIRLDYG